MMVPSVREVRKLIAGSCPRFIVVKLYRVNRRNGRYEKEQNRKETHSEYDLKEKY